MSTPTTSALEAQFKAYLKAFNAHSFDEYSQFWTDDIFLHLPLCPPLQGKAAIKQLLDIGLNYFRETIHPTFLIQGDKTLAIEAKVATEVVQDMAHPFPFTGKTYSKGDKFVYNFVIHYEFSDDLLIKTFRAFSLVFPDPGQGILQKVVDGYDPVPMDYVE